MTIKEVSELTGLSHKCIRYYEEKGLVNVKREEQNDYRNYNEENIEKLKLIKILRYLNFSIEEIENTFEADNLSEALKEKARQLGDESSNYQDKKELCNTLEKSCKLKDFKDKINDYSNSIDFFESDEGEKIKNSILSTLSPNLSATIVGSLIFSGPIISLFINIKTEKWDTLIINSIAAIICSMLFISNWIWYFIFRSKHKEILKKKNKKTSLLIPFLIFVPVFAILLFVMSVLTTERLMAPDDYLFFEIPLIPIILMMISIVLLLGYVIGIIFRRFKIHTDEIKEIPTDMAKKHKLTSIIYKSGINRIDTEEPDLIVYLVEKYKIIAIILFIIFMYVFFTSTTYVTNDEIIYHSPLHPLGIHYKYSDVNKIETGFGRKNFTFMEKERKGRFYYTIYIDDKKITFMQPSTNPEVDRYKEDTYLELEEFDQELMKYNIEKISDDEFSESCNLDQRFVDRFLRIINNK